MYTALLYIVAFIIALFLLFISLPFDIFNIIKIKGAENHRLDETQKRRIFYFLWFILFALTAVNLDIKNIPVTKDLIGVPGSWWLTFILFAGFVIVGIAIDTLIITTREFQSLGKDGIIFKENLKTADNLIENQMTIIDMYADKLECQYNIIYKEIPQIITSVERHINDSLRGRMYPYKACDDFIELIKKYIKMQRYNTELFIYDRSTIKNLQSEFKLSITDFEELTDKVLNNKGWNSGDKYERKILVFPYKIDYDSTEIMIALEYKNGQLIAEDQCIILSILSFFDKELKLTVAKVVSQLSFQAYK